MNREPLVNAALVVAIVAAGLQVLVAFGLGLTDVQVQSIMGFVTVIAPLAVAALARSKVTPLSDPRDSDGVGLVRVNAEEIYHVQQD